MAPEMEADAARRALIVISLGVLLATSTWFSGTAAARELSLLWALDDRASARLTSATQWGFIAGTLIYALANLADRFDARRVFCVSALVADSPQFSALAARHAPAEYTGTAQNGIGFLITIGSLELIPLLAEWIGWRWAFTALAIGPLCGLLAFAQSDERSA